MSSRIPPIERDTASPDVQSLLDHAAREGAPDPRIVAVYANSSVGTAFFQFWNVVMGPTRLPLRLKELVRIANAAGKECAYCSIVRSESAKREGVSEEFLMELADYPGSTVLS